MSNINLNISNIDFAHRANKSRFQVLSKISFECNANSVNVIIGPSGCGKSTLLNLIAGIKSPDNGSIIFKRNDEIIKPKVGYVFQTPSLIPWRTVRQNIFLGAEIVGEISEKKENDAERLLLSYGLKKFENSYPSTLSGGMQQRVAIIRAVLADANILLLDEPFSDSDFVMKRELQQDLLRIVEEQNLIAIMVTHDLIEAVKIADQILILSERPATVKKKININDNHKERMQSEWLIKNEFYKHIETINEALIETAAIK